MIKPNTQARWLTIGLILATALSVPLDSHAKKAVAKPAAKVEKSQPKTATTPAKPKSAAQHKEAKPVLDAATRKNIEESALKLDVDTRKSMNLLSDSLHEEDRTIYNEIRDDEEMSLTDIGMLWEAAVERSGTIRYAIEKLSRRDATGKPVEGDNFSKRMLGSLVHLGGVAGSMWTGTPAGLIGSGMIQDLMSGSPQQDPALARVTDADMVILAKEVEELQNQLITLYYNYKHSQERLSLAQDAQRTINQYCDHAESKADGESEALKPLMQSLVESARQDVQNAQQGYNSSRSALSGVVGPDAIAALDQSSKNGKKSASLNN